MATILQKTPADKCVVLNSRESLWYPLNLGVWTGLSIGMMVSFTSSGNTNGLYTGESIPYTGANCGIFWGIADSGSYQPLQSGYFVGVATATGFDGTSGTIDGTGSVYGAANSLWSIAGSGGISTPLGIHSGFNIASPPLATGTGFFATFAGMKVEVTGLGTSGQSVRVLMSSDQALSGTNMTAITGLTGILSAFPPFVTASPYGYYTTGFVNGGGPLPIPSGLYVYMPFVNNRLRIHSIYAQAFN